MHLVLTGSHCPHSAQGADLKLLHGMGPMANGDHAAAEARARLGAPDGVRRVGSQPHLFHFDGQDPTKMLPVHGAPRKLAARPKPAAPDPELEDESPRIASGVGRSDQLLSIRTDYKRGST